MANSSLVHLVSPSETPTSADSLRHSSSSSSMTMLDEEFDLIGIGFGPANLALAVALSESPEAQEKGVRFAFLEKQAEFAWHSSLLLPGSQLQVSPLKDLAMMRDPTSSYTFFNFLHQKGRLAAYINRDASVPPSRREWSAYLAWAAKRLDDVVTYNQEVVSVEPESSSQVDPSATPESVRLLRITCRDVSTGRMLIRRARNITVAVGGVPRLPASFRDLYHSDSLSSSEAKQVVHSSAYLSGLAALEPMLRKREASRINGEQPPTSLATSLHMDTRRPAPLRFAVIGGGQSSAEMCLHLHKTFPSANVKLIFRASALVPSEDSAFVNSVAFDPDRTDIFWRANAEDRQAWLQEYRRTNYSVVRTDVLNELHNTLYDQGLDFDSPWPNAAGPTTSGGVELLANTQVYRAEKNKEGTINLHMSDTKHLRPDFSQSFDTVFLGTGFERQAKVLDFLRPLSTFFPLLDEQSERRKAELGFGNEDEKNSPALCQLAEAGDEEALERLRQRTRGVARDYRLVSYYSNAFIQDNTIVSAREDKATAENSARRQSDSTTTSSSSSSTLAGSDDAADPEQGKVFQPAIFFLGGNEQTHGLSDSLLSIVAHRAGELRDTILESSASFAKVSASEKSLPHTQSEAIIKSAAATRFDSLPIETLQRKVESLQVA